jgi:uncharacterized LabA/DUF88 family protein
VYLQYTYQVDTVLLVDGENFKRKIDAVFRIHGQERPQWHRYEFRTLLNSALEGVVVDRIIFYFARIKEHPHTREKSRQLIQDQRLLKTHLERQGFAVTLSGSVRGQTESDAHGVSALVFKEKGTDVKIAVDMIRLACDKEARTIILGSSDSDLQPAITEVKKRSVTCVYLGFEAQPNKGLSYTTDRTILIRDNEVLKA